MNLKPGNLKPGRTRCAAEAAPFMKSATFFLFHCSVMTPSTARHSEG